MVLWFEASLPALTFVFTFMTFSFRRVVAPTRRAGRQGLPNDCVVVSSELSCLDVCFQVHRLSPFLEFWARAEAWAAEVNERSCYGLQRAFLP
jgi:hypothetical protein